MWCRVGEVVFLTLTLLTGQFLLQDFSELTLLKILFHFV